MGRIDELRKHPESEDQSHCTYQLFRHSVLTQTAIRGIDTQKIQAYAGYTSFQATHKYIDKTSISFNTIQGINKDILARQLYSKSIEMTQ